MTRALRKSLRVTGWVLLSIIGLFLLIFLLIQTPAGQNFARKRIVIYLENKLKTDVEIGKLSVDFPRRVVLENVYFADQKKDTLLAGRKIAVDIDLWELISSNVIIKHAELEGIRANIYRLDPDSTFNFDYIVKAFAPAKTSKAADTTAMKIELNTLDLKNVIANFHDDRTGNDMFVNVGSLHASIDTLNPEKLIYSIPTLQGSNITVTIRQYKPLVKEEPMARIEAESNQPTDVRVRLKDIDLDHINFKYDNTLANINTDVQLGKMTADIRDLNLATLNIDMSRFQLDSTKAVIHFGRTPEARATKREVTKEVKAQVNNPWKITLDEFAMNHNDIKYDDDNSPRVYRGIDYAHLDAKDVNVKATGLHFAPDKSEGSIQQLAMREKSGLNLREARTDFIYTDQNITLDPLYVRTDRTILRDRVELNFPSLASIAKDPGSLAINANIDNSTIAVRDIILFAPALADVSPFNHYPNDIFFLDADVNGLIRDLRIPHFNFRGLNNTSLNATAHIKGLPNPNSTYYDLNVIHISTNKGDILNLLPPNAIPSTVRLPNAYNGSGQFKGTINNYSIKTNMRTDRGAVNMTAFVSNGGKTYTARGSVAALDLGYIMKRTDVGRVSAYVNIRGNGFDPKTATIVGEANIHSAYYNGYTYKDIALDGELRKGIVNATAKGTDPNAAFDLVINADLNAASPTFALKGSLQNINLKALNLSNQSMIIHANVDADFLNADPDNLRGTAVIKDIVLTIDGKQYSADSIYLRADSGPTGNSLLLSSSALAVNFQGQYKLTEIVTAVQTTINRYYTIPGFKPAPFAPQNWTLTATLYQSPLLYQFAPQLKGSDSIFLNASFNSIANDLRLNAKARTLVFNDNKFDSLNLNAATQPDRLNYSVTAYSAGTEAFKLDRTSVSGFVANNRVTLDADIKDTKGVSKYQLAGVAQQIPGGVEFSLRQGSVMFNYEQWTVGSNNFIRYTDQGILINNFTISHGTESLSLQSDPLQTNAPILARFSNFKIATITRIAQQQQLLMDGTMNGTALIKNPMSDNRSFTADMTVTDFIYKGDTLGNITAKINNETANALAADIRLTGGKNDVRVFGKYFLNDKSMDLTADLGKLDLKTVLPFSQGQIRDAGGYIKGIASIKGTFANPIINGDLGFDSAFVAPTFLGERFTLPSQNIKFTQEGFALNNFVLTDSLGNKAVIDGSLNTKDFKTFNYNMYVSMDNFRVINTTKKINQLYYGSLTVDSELEIWGTLDRPNVDGYVRINKNTDFGFILPGNNPELISREGVVRFIDTDNPGDTVFLNPIDTLLARTGLTGLDLYLDVSTDTSAQLALVVDERNGDILKFRGRGDLSAGVDRSGKISLTGTYELMGGSYTLNFNLLRREFDIVRGSYVTWTGEPTTALVDIRATYTANTASIDLVEPQLVGRSPAEVNRYKQRLPFIVSLNMSGELLKPIFSFDIALPENQAAQWKDVADKLEDVRRDEAETNKQVFALLLLNRFVQENPFQSSASTGNPIASFARQSVSRLLTEQLNNLAGNLIKGVDLNFGVISQDDFTTGERQNRTDLNVTLSKRLMDDRLRVSVGNNFELEGPQNVNSTKANIAGDIAIDYLLSRDGRYLLRVYRRNQYDFVVEGQVIETGVSFIFALDFETVRDLFKRSSESAVRARLRKATPNTNANTTTQ